MEHFKNFGRYIPESIAGAVLRWGWEGTGPPVFVQAPQFQKVWQRAMLGITKSFHVGYNVCTNNVVWQLWRIQGANLAMTSNWILGGCPIDCESKRQFRASHKKFFGAMRRIFVKPSYKVPGISVLLLT